MKSCVFVDFHYASHILRRGSYVMVPTQLLEAKPKKYMNYSKMERKKKKLRHTLNIFEPYQNCSSVTSKTNKQLSYMFKLSLLPVI